MSPKKVEHKAFTNPYLHKKCREILSVNDKLARMAAHRAFDELWKTASERSAAYRWLAEKLGVPMHRCHFKLMDRWTCNRVKMICERASIEEIAAWQERNEGDN